MISHRSLLVAVDCRQPGHSLIAHAWQQAAAGDCELHFLHVIPRSLFSQDSVPRDHDQTLQQLQELTGLPPESFASATGFHHEVRYGSPAREILDFAREHGVGTILLGAHKKSGLTRLVVGSVAEAVLREAPCPVVVVPEKPASEPVADEETDEAAGDLIRQPPLIRAGSHHSGDSNRVVDLLQRAIHWRATDIHIDPVDQHRVWIRFRVDGKLRTFCHLDENLASPLLMQLKLMADFDTTEWYEPQEGRLKLPVSMSEIEVRTTMVPACDGISVSLRLLHNEARPRPLTELGMSEPTLQTVQSMLQHHEGLVLVTGPTGSGKTTTVYAMLQSLGYADRNIVSIEDPVEYRVPGIRQLSVNLRHDFTMARGLKTLLRMDPDVVFIGEIRDVEALEIAMRAGSSGRYVFSTLHTRDVASTITALRDMHVDNYSLSGNLTGIVSQRLIRCLCGHCKLPTGITDEEQAIFAAAGLESPGELYRPHGCERCMGSGYRERIGVFEAVVACGDVVTALQRGAPEEELRQIIRETNSRSLAQEALLKARDGLTSLEEANSLSWTR